MKTTPMPFSQIAAYAWKFLRQYPGRLFLSFLGILGGALCDLITPLIAGELADFLAENASNPSAATEGAFTYLGYLIAIGILYWFCKQGSWFIWARVVVNSMRQLTEEALYKVQRFSTDWHESSFAGATVTKIKRGMRGLQRFIDLFYYNFVPTALVMLGMVIIVTLKFSTLGLVIIIGSIIYASLSIYLSLKYVMPSSTEENRHDSQVGASLADTISCNATVKSFAQERSEDKRFKTIVTGFRDASLRAWHRSHFTSIAQSAVMTCYKIAFLGGAIWLWTLGEFTVGDVVFVLASYRMISSYLRQIGDNIRQLQMAASDMEDAVGFAHQDFDVQDIKQAKPITISKGDICFDEVTFTYSNQHDALFQDFSVHIKAGEKIALVGPSGSGKTTFVKLLQRLYDIQRGKILIDGQDIAHVTLRSLRQSLVLVPQEPILFHRTLAENITYGNPKTSQKCIQKVAEKAHAHEFINKLPQGYKTLVGERGIKLSGGERQRVAIARAILSQAKVLIMDEATSSLDSVSEKFIQDAMEKLMEKRTTIIIAHRLSTIKKVDRILVFEGGRIVEEGNHQSLVHKTNGVYQRLYQMQAGGFIE